MNDDEHQGFMVIVLFIYFNASCMISHGHCALGMVRVCTQLNGGFDFNRGFYVQSNYLTVWGIFMAGKLNQITFEYVFNLAVMGNKVRVNSFLRLPLFI